MKILMIDDDEDTNLLIGFLLNKIDFIDSYRIEQSAKKALSVLKNKEFEPNYIFVDLAMPEMDGYEFVEKYEQCCSKESSTTQIYMLSSSARQSDRKNIEKYKSVKEFILKPLTKEKLRQIIFQNPN